MSEYFVSEKYYVISCRKDDDWMQVVGTYYSLDEAKDDASLSPDYTFEIVKVVGELKLYTIFEEK
jgi:hypothetical protein